MKERKRTAQKITAFFLAASLIFGLTGFMAFAETDSPNLVRNGGFDTVGSLKTDWDYEANVPVELPDAEGNVISRLVITNEMANSDGRSGYAFKIENKEKNLNVWAKQQFLTTKNQIIPGVTYRLSYRIYADNLGDRKDSGVGCFLAYYTSTGSDATEYYLSGTEFLYEDSTTNGRWTEISGTFVFPAEAKRLRLLLRSYAVGTVYFDDISLEQVEAEAFEYYASHVFHYADEEQGAIKVSVLPYYQSGANQLDEKSLHVKFGIYDGVKYITGQDNVPFTDFEAVCTYSVDKLTVLKKQYTLKVSVLNAQNKELDSYTQSLYKYERPNFLDENGNFRGVDGEIVSPVIAFHLNEKYFEKARKAGFTMFQMPYESILPENKAITNNLLDAGQKEGLYGLFSLYLDMKAAAHPDNIEYTKEIVNIFKDDRRFIGWVAQDEPLGGGITEEAKALLELSYKTIRDIDPNHPVILTDYRKAVFKETVKYCDIFIPNSYGTDTEGVRSYVEESVKYAHGKPVYPNVAAYSKSLDGLPSGQQVQHFIHQAFLAGAKGVSVYAVNDAVNDGAGLKIPLFNTPIWGPLVDTGNTEIPVLFDLFVYGKDRPREKEASTYVERIWTRDDGDYYFLMSTSETEGATVEYDIGAGKGIRLLGGDSTEYFTLSGGKLTVRLDAFDVLMFKVFDKSCEAQITLNGIGIKNMMGDTELTYLPPAGATKYVVALYRNENGKEILEWVHWPKTATFTGDLIFKSEQYDFTAKVFAWDDAMRPIGKMAVAAPMPKE